MENKAKDHYLVHKFNKQIHIIDRLWNLKSYYDFEDAIK